MITYDDFAKLEIKIGEIISAEIVEGADKLLRLMVDVGEETPRQIVSGIREYFEAPEMLVGMKAPFLTNLEPRVIRGLESQGMILAIGGDDAFALLVPHADVPKGSRVK